MEKAVFWNPNPDLWSAAERIGFIRFLEKTYRCVKALTAAEFTEAAYFNEILTTLFVRLRLIQNSPNNAIKNAIAPLNKTLLEDRFFNHSNLHVRVGVAACISEIIGIHAPKLPFNAEQMKDIFKLIVHSFEDLHNGSRRLPLKPRVNLIKRRSYFKRIRMLENMAGLKYWILMLRLECHEVVVDMFQNFLKGIRAHHSEKVFSSMESIMTGVLKESKEMLLPILPHVTKDNNEVSEVSRRLAEKVLGNCASELKTHLIVAEKSSFVSLDSYSDIVASICKGTLQHDQLFGTEKEETPSEPEEVEEIIRSEPKEVTEMIRSEPKETFTLMDDFSEETSVRSTEEASETPSETKEVEEIIRSDSEEGFMLTKLFSEETCERAPKDESGKSGVSNFLLRVARKLVCGLPKKHLGGLLKQYPQKS